MSVKARRTDDAARAAREVRAHLRRQGSARRAAGMRAYFKRDETVRFFGVAAPEIRRIARETWLTRRHVWSVRDATRCCDLLIRQPELEGKSVGVLVLERWHREFPRSLLRRARGWLGAGHCASWAAVDLVAPTLLTPLIVRYPEMERQVASWTRARSLWVQRAAAVTFVPLARHGQSLDSAYAVATNLLSHRHDLIHKAVGWLLREAGKTDPARLERFLLAAGPRVPRTTVRYAIERFPPTKRARLLRDTRLPSTTAVDLFRIPSAGAIP
jgi:3-methyladenine DNA glycosylase AlkD